MIEVVRIVHDGLVVEVVGGRQQAVTVVDRQRAVEVVDRQVAGAHKSVVAHKKIVALHMPAMGMKRMPVDPHRPIDFEVPQSLILPCQNK